MLYKFTYLLTYLLGNGGIIMKSKRVKYINGSVFKTFNLSVNLAEK